MPRKGAEDPSPINPATIRSKTPAQMLSPGVCRCLPAARPKNRQGRVDTGVLVSAFAFDGKPYEAVSRALSDTEIWVLPELLTEYRHAPVELEAAAKNTRE
jgi:hypothetical protein